MSELYMTGATIDEVLPLLRENHYLGNRRTADPMYVFAWREAGGLFGDYGQPRAAIVYCSPINRYFGTGAIELSRLVRAENLKAPLSSFVAWSLRWLRSQTDLRYCLSYADQSAGHHGGIYQALSFDYVAVTDGNTSWRNTTTGEICSGRSFDQRRPEFKEGWERTKSAKKHLYIRALNERSEKLMARFGWIPLAYPKPRNIDVK